MNPIYKLFLLFFLLTSYTMFAQDKKIIQAEYFWDTDPGNGSGTAFTAADGSLDEAVETIINNNVSILSVGIHRFYIRVKDWAGIWGPTFSSLIEVGESVTLLRDIEINSGEYFWDTDPGAGSGSALIAFDGNFDEAAEQAIASIAALPAIGPHLFFVRFQDGDLDWSPVFQIVVSVEESVEDLRSIQISEAEFFWDNDPGVGNGTPLLAQDGNFNEVIETVINQTTIGLSQGLHIFHVRMKDPENVWSDTFDIVVDVWESTTEQREIFVAAGEYWFDADPGQGNATPVVALDGTFNKVIEGIIGGEIPSPVASGMHALWIRAQDPQGGWGPPFGIVVNMDIDIGTFTTQISGTNNICSGTDQLGVNYSCIAANGSTYTWTISGGVIISGAGTTNITVNWNTAVNHSLTLEQCIGVNCQTDVLDVVIHESASQTNNVFICEGESYFAGGANQTEAGVYEDLFTTSFGCDSTVTTILSVFDNITTNTTASICQGQNIILGGLPRTTPGTYLDTYTAAGGCDSLVYTTLSVHPTYNQNIVVEICDGQTYFVGGALQSSEGFYTDVFDTAFGCDSVVVTHLIVNESINTDQFVDICQGESFFAGGTDQTETGIYIDQINGDCAETLTTHLTVHNTYDITQQVSICSGQSYYAGGAFQTSEGIYLDLYQSAFGCDSLVTTQLTVGDVINNNQYISICEGESFFAGGANQTSPGTYIDLVTNTECTETLTTYLSVNPNPATEQEVTICEGQSYFAGGAFQTAAGTYIDVYQSNAGCDSTVTTNLSLTEAFNTQTNVTICDGDSIFLANDWQYQAGVYTDLFQSAGGCDSIVVTLLNIASSPPQPFVEQLGDFNVHSDVIADSTTWIFNVEGCDIAPLTLPGSVLDFGILIELICGAMTGNISAIAFINGCSSEVSAEALFITEGVENLDPLFSLSVYPNPTTGLLTLSGSAVQPSSFLQVINSLGEVVLADRIKSGNMSKIDLTDLAQGMYWIKIFNDEKFATRRVVVD